MTSAAANIYLNEQNELSKTVAETNVVITQPAARPPELGAVHLG